MSFAAFKMMHWPTGVENCASGYITQSLSDSTLQIPIVSGDDDMEAEWPNHKRGIGPLPNVVITAGNILEVYIVRAQEDGNTQELRIPKLVKRGGVMDGVSGVSLELVCHYRYVFVDKISPKLLQSGTLIL